MNVSTRLKAAVVGCAVTAAAACGGNGSDGARSEGARQPAEHAADSPAAGQVPITLSGCLQQNANNDFILTRVNEPTQSVGTAGDASPSTPGAARPVEGVVEREQLRAAAGAYRVDAGEGMNLTALVGKRVHIVGVIKENMDLPRPNESTDRVTITEGDLTRIGATSVSTVAENCGVSDSSAGPAKASPAAAARPRAGSRSGSMNGVRNSTRNGAAVSTRAAGLQAANAMPAAATAEPGNADQVTTLPDTQVWLGTVRLSHRVQADGAILPAGSYRVRLTGKHAEKDALGQSEQLERWVEFVQSNTVKGRAMAPVVPGTEVNHVTGRDLPSRGSVRVERLREDDHYRLWFNYRGEQVLVYLPIA